MLEEEVELLDVYVARNINDEQRQRLDGAKKVGIKLHQFEPLLLIAHDVSFEYDYDGIKMKSGSL